MGLTNLESIDEFIAVNYGNYKSYEQELRGLPGVSLITYDQKEKYNYQYVILEIDESITRVTRDQIVDMLRAENVLARRYFHPGCHRMEPYRSHFPHAGLVLPETERLTKRVLSLPTGTAVGPDEIRKICQIMRIAIVNGPEAKKRLSGHAAKESKKAVMFEGLSV